MSNKDWRIETDSMDYFQHQKKTIEVSDRRPVIRKAGDLVGPGIGANSTRIDDYSDLLATFNGYYSSAPGASNAPNATEAFVGYVISDAELGGTQIFTSLSTGIEFTRLFERSPTAPETIGWGEWRGQRIPATAQGYDKIDTPVPNGWSLVLPAPALVTVGDSDVYESTSAGVLLKKQGVYSGSVQVGDLVGATVATVFLYVPVGNEIIQLGQIGVPLGPTVHIPFTAVATDNEQAVSVLVQQSSGAERAIWWRFSCTRVGDAT